MVRIVNSTSGVYATGKCKPFIVELVGPTGAGKTTLAKNLRKLNNNILISKHPYFRYLKDIPFFIWSGIYSLPIIFYFYHCRRLTPWELATIIILNGWYRVLSQPAVNNGTVIILDQGPVNMLYSLQDTAPELFCNRKTINWLNTMYERWAGVLNMIIWLDASDNTLLKRVFDRKKWHRIMEKSVAGSYEFLASCRRVYDGVLSAITSRASGPDLFRLDTTNLSVEGVCDEAIAAFNHKMR